MCCININENELITLWPIKPFKYWEQPYLIIKIQVNKSKFQVSRKVLITKIRVFHHYIWKWTYLTINNQTSYALCLYSKVGLLYQDESDVWSVEESHN